MRDRPKTKSQRKAWDQANLREMTDRAAAARNSAVTASADRLGSFGNGEASL